MLRRFIVLTSIAAGTAMAVTATIATPALAKGATQASITGPGLARPVTVSAAQGEAMPGQGDALSNLADQTGLFTVLFGPGTSRPDGPSRLRTPPAAASLGPEYILTYTVPGVSPAPGQAAGQIRQDLYPRAPGGPLIYTPPGQHGFDQPLQASGWFRGSRQLTATLTRLGVPRGAARPSGASATASVPGWLISMSVSAAAIMIAGTALWLRRRFRPAAGRPATEETSAEQRREPAVRSE